MSEITNPSFNNPSWGEPLNPEINPAKALSKKEEKVNELKNKINTLSPVHSSSDALLSIYKEEKGESDIDNDLAEELDALLLNFVIEIGSDSPFFNSDLVVFRDDYKGQLPINGIKETEYKEICEIIKKIASGNTCFKMDSTDEDFNKTVNESLLTLLTRHLGRVLLKKVMDRYENQPVPIRPGEKTAARFRGNSSQEVTIAPENKFHILEINPLGKLQLRKEFMPLYIILAHELVHISHGFDEFSANQGALLSSELEYDDLEELVTITGFKENMDLSQYDELNERLITAVFTDKDKHWLPRVGHRIVIEKPSDLTNLEGVRGYIRSLLRAGVSDVLIEFLKEVNMDLNELVRNDSNNVLFLAAADDHSLQSALIFHDQGIVDEKGNRVEHFILKYGDVSLIKQSLLTNLDFLTENTDGVSPIKLLENEIDAKLEIIRYGLEDLKVARRFMGGLAILLEDVTLLNTMAAKADLVGNKGEVNRDKLISQVYNPIIEMALQKQNSEACIEKIKAALPSKINLIDKLVQDVKDK